MKIIYLHQFFKFPSDTGGIRSYDLATSFLKEGIEVEVVTTSAFLNSVKLGPGWNLIEKDGLKVHVLSLNYNNKLPYINRIVVFFKFLWFSCFKLLTLRCDL